MVSQDDINEMTTEDRENYIINCHEKCEKYYNNLNNLHNINIDLETYIESIQRSNYNYNNNSDSESESESESDIDNEDIENDINDN